MNRTNSFGNQKLSILDKIIYFMRIQQIKKHYNFDNKVIVDVWCGYNAVFLNYIKNKFSPKKLIAFDLKLNKEKLSDIWIKSIEWNLNNKFNLWEDVDLILGTAILEHLSDPITFLKSCYDNLQKWWCLLLTMPSIRSKPVLEFMAFRLKLIDSIEIIDHKEYYTKNKLIRYLELAWFERKNIKHNYFELYMNNFVLVKK